MNTRSRLSPPLGAYVPPATAQQAPVQTVAPSSTLVTADFETAYREVELPLNGQPARQVFSTTRRWKALDVYVSRPRNLNLLGGYVVSVAVYARVGGLRVLVATGRLGASDAFGATDRGIPIWVCAARCQAQTFEVEIASNIPVAVGGPIGVGMFGSDHALDVPDVIGEIAMAPELSDTPSPNVSISSAGVPLLLTGVHAVNTSAVAAFALVFDKTSPGAASASPLLVFALAAGQSVIAHGDLLRGRRSFVGADDGFCVVASSTAPVYTAAAAGLFLNGWAK